MISSPSYGRWQASGSAFASPQTPSTTEYLRSSNLIGFRYRTFVESAIQRMSIPYGTHEEIFLREQALFLSVAAATSCIEATSYATYALASESTVLGVPFDTKVQRDCNPRTLLARCCLHRRLIR